MTVPKRFSMLRFLAALLRVIAWVVLILSIIAGIAVALSTTTSLLQTPSLVAIPVLGPVLNFLGATGGGIVAGVLAVLGGLLYFIVVFAAAETLSLNLAVEENTRLTAALLLRMHQESQPDARAAGYGTYASEPFEG
jgi:hypothetical protein